MSDLRDTIWVRFEATPSQVKLTTQIWPKTILENAMLVWTEGLNKEIITYFQIDLGYCGQGQSLLNGMEWTPDCVYYLFYIYIYYLLYQFHFKNTNWTELSAPTVCSSVFSEWAQVALVMLTSHSMTFTMLFVHSGPKCLENSAS